MGIKTRPNLGSGMGLGSGNGRMGLKKHSRLSLHVLRSPSTMGEKGQNMKTEKAVKGAEIGRSPTSLASRLTAAHVVTLNRIFFTRHLLTVSRTVALNILHDSSGDLTAVA